MPKEEGRVYINPLAGTYEKLDKLKKENAMLKKMAEAYKNCAMERAKAEKEVIVLERRVRAYRSEANCWRRKALKKPRFAMQVRSS